MNRIEELYALQQTRGYLADDDLRADVQVDSVLYIKMPEEPGVPCLHESCAARDWATPTMLPLPNKDQLVLIRGSTDRPLKHIKLPTPESMRPEDRPIRLIVLGIMGTLAHSN